MHGQEHTDAGGQAVVQPDQRQLEKVGGGALDYSVDYVAAGFRDGTGQCRIDVR